MRKRVLLDVDGVLADFVGAYLGLLKSTQGIDATPEQITTWDIASSLGLTKAQSAQIKRAIGDCTGLARVLAVCPGAVFGVRALEEAADVYIVTSPWNSNPTWTHDREHWLLANFGIPSKRVTHTSAKYLCRGDFFVDDKASAVAKWQTEHPQGVGVLWCTPHNQLDVWTGVRTCDWGELLAMVQR